MALPGWGESSAELAESNAGQMTIPQNPNLDTTMGRPMGIKSNKRGNQMRQKKVLKWWRYGVDPWVVDVGPIPAQRHEFRSRRGLPKAQEMRGTRLLLDGLVRGGGKQALGLTPLAGGGEHHRTAWAAVSRPISSNSSRCAACSADSPASIAPGASFSHHGGKGWAKKPAGWLDPTLGSRVPSGCSGTSTMPPTTARLSPSSPYFRCLRQGVGQTAAQTKPQQCHSRASEREVCGQRKKRPVRRPKKSFCLWKERSCIVRILPHINPLPHNKSPGGRLRHFTMN